jgi:hypothetical protein
MPQFSLAPDPSAKQDGQDGEEKGIEGIEGISTISSGNCTYPLYPLYPHFSLWSLLRLHTQSNRPAWCSDGPVRRGEGWPAHVAAPQTDAELVALRRSVERGIPYGSKRWQNKNIAKLGLESTFRPRGHPRKTKQ